MLIYFWDSAATQVRLLNGHTQVMFKDKSEWHFVWETHRSGVSTRRMPVVVILSPFPLAADSAAGTNRVGDKY